VQETRQQRIEHFKTAIYGRVDGWLGDRMWQIVDVIGTIPTRTGCVDALMDPVINMVLICPADAVAPLANRLGCWTDDPRYW